jgi:hypothetical protein
VPKLVIKPLGQSSDQVWDVEQAKDRLSFKGKVILVDGRRVRSYDELVAVVTQERYADKEFIDVVIMPVMAGG